jgi:hypothetical protein
MITRTRSPVSPASWSASTNRIPIGVAITRTRHPALCASRTKSATPDAAGAAHTTRYKTLPCGAPMLIIDDERNLHQRVTPPDHAVIWIHPVRDADRSNTRCKVLSGTARLCLELPA